MNNTILSSRGGMSSVRLTGEPYAQGFQHGRATADSIRVAIAEIRRGMQDMAARGRTYDYDTIVDSAFEYAVKARPGLDAELEGIAAGAEVDFRDILHHNFPVYLLATLLPWECTQVLIGPERSADGQTRLAKTRDTKGDRMTNVVLHRTMPDGMELVEVTHAGSITLTGAGVNSEGLMFGTSGIWSKRTVLPFDEAGSRLMSPDVGGLLQTATTVDEFRAGIEQHPRLGNLNLVCADGKTGALSALETTSDEVYRFDAEDGYIVRTNHFHSPELAGASPTPEEYPSTYLRYETAVDKLTAGPVSHDGLWDIVSSHEHGDRGAICRHPGGSSVTTCAAVTSWPAGDLDAWVGVPCERTT